MRFMPPQNVIIPFTKLSFDSQMNMKDDGRIVSELEQAEHGPTEHIECGGYRVA